MQEKRAREKRERERERDLHKRVIEIHDAVDLKPARRDGIRVNVWLTGPTGDKHYVKVDVRTRKCGNLNPASCHGASLLALKTMVPIRGIKRNPLARWLGRVDVADGV